MATSGIELVPFLGARERTSASGQIHSNGGQSLQEVSCCTQHQIIEAVNDGGIILHS
jgi:hypothetical protein